MTLFLALELEEREEKHPSEDLTSEAKTGEEEPEVIWGQVMVDPETESDSIQILREFMLCFWNKIQFNRYVYMYLHNVPKSLKTLKKEERTILVYVHVNKQALTC